MLNSHVSELRHQFAQLHKASGIIVERAHEIVQELSYFGTMLVFNRNGRRHDIWRCAHYRANCLPRVWEYQNGTRHLHGVQSFLDVPV